MLSPFLLPIVLCGLLIPTLLACMPSGPPQDVNTRFRLATLDGGEMGPQDFADKVILLDFWATWCGPCHDQADILKPLYTEYRPQGFEVLSIDVEEAPEHVAAFVENNSFPYPILLDPRGEVSSRFAVMGLPTLVILNRRGEVAFAHTGVLTEQELRREIEALLS